MNLTNKGASDYEVILIAAGSSQRLAQLTRDIPKPFLEVGGTSIIERNLDALHALGVRHAICVVGYLKHTFYERIGNMYKDIEITYVESLDYETTGHGWSFYKTRTLWEKSKRPVLFLHADIVFSPEILRRVWEHPAENVISTDEQYQSKTGDEVLVYGTRERVTSIVHPSFQKVKESANDLLGESVSINKWSVSYMEDFFAFMEQFFEKNGRNYNWEPVLDAFIPHSRHKLVPVFTGGLPWVNINYEEDLREAKQMAENMKGS